MEALQNVLERPGQFGYLHSTEELTETGGEPECLHQEEEGVQMVRDLLRKDDFLVSIDLKDT